MLMAELAEIGIVISVIRLVMGLKVCASYCVCHVSVENVAFYIAEKI